MTLGIICKRIKIRKDEFTVNMSKLTVDTANIFKLVVHIDCSWVEVFKVNVNKVNMFKLFFDIVYMYIDGGNMLKTYIELSFWTNPIFS